MCARNPCRFAFAAALSISFFASPAAADVALQIGNTLIERVAFHECFTGYNDYFGALLFNTDGSLVKHDGNKTWMYTGDKLADGTNRSFVREFNLDTLEVGETRLVLAPTIAGTWTMIHNVVKVADDMYVAFYSTGSVVRTAVCNSPTGTFEPDADFAIGRSQAWESGSLESNGGMVKISENDAELQLWVLYDNLGSGTSGQNAWARVRIDKNSGKVELLGKHANNPLPLLLPDHIAARTGGNLDSSVRIDGKYPLFYMSKLNRSTYRIGLALSEDPLFQTLAENVELDTPLGSEKAIEKFQFYEHNDSLFLIYEDNTHRGTGLREYRLRVVPEPDSPALLATALLPGLLFIFAVITCRGSAKCSGREGVPRT